MSARARQRMSAADRASEFEASTAEQASERVVKANERTFLLKSQFVYSSSPGPGSSQAAHILLDISDFFSQMLNILSF